MRVIAGTLGGRQFEAPKGHRTHPMSDRVKGGLFSVLGDISGLTLLDAFAGSGALSFEAVSRGAKQVTAVDVDRKAHQTIKLNVEKLGVKDYVKPIRASISGWSNNNPDSKFDLIFSAPPYDKLQLDVVKKLTSHLKPGGLLVLDWPGKLEVPELGNLQLEKNRKYGDAQLVFYRKTE